MLQLGASDEADQAAKRSVLTARVPLAMIGWGRLSRNDRAALAMWAAAHLALFVLAWAAMWVYRSAPSHEPLTREFEGWDAVLLRNIAQHGYFSPHSIANNTAFFPGYPAALAAVHLVLRSWVLSELAVSGIAGCFAVIWLSRLAGGRRAVGYLLTAPAAIFLMVGYSECLFLALAIPAWHAATRGQWWRAALLAGLSGLVRPDAVFLIPALAVMAITGPRQSRVANAAKASSALAGPAAYVTYLTVHAGTWQTWVKAQQAGWGLHPVTPIQAAKATWLAAWGYHLSAGYAFEQQLELAAMAVMLLATFAFLWWYRWPEAVYCGLAAISLGALTWYQTCTRTLLILFPVWIALARLDVRRPWIRYAYVGVSAPLAAVLGLLYLSGHWAG